MQKDQALKRLQLMRKAWGMFAITREAFVAQAACYLDMAGIDSRTLGMKTLAVPGTNGHTVDVESCGLRLDQAFATQVMDVVDSLVEKHTSVTPKPHYTEVTFGLSQADEAVEGLLANIKLDPDRKVEIHFDFDPPLVVPEVWEIRPDWFKMRGASVVYLAMNHAVSKITRDKKLLTGYDTPSADIRRALRGVRIRAWSA